MLSNAVIWFLIADFIWFQNRKAWTVLCVPMHHNPTNFQSWSCKPSHGILEANLVGFKRPNPKSPIQVVWKVMLRSVIRDCHIGSLYRNEDDGCSTTMFTSGLTAWTMRKKRACRSRANITTQLQNEISYNIIKNKTKNIIFWTFLNYFLIPPDQSWNINALDKKQCYGWLHWPFLPQIVIHLPLDVALICNARLNSSIQTASTVVLELSVLQVRACTAQHSDVFWHVLTYLGLLGHTMLLGSTEWKMCLLIMWQRDQNPVADKMSWPSSSLMSKHCPLNWFRRNICLRNSNF